MIVGTLIRRTLCPERKATDFGAAGPIDYIAQAAGLGIGTSIHVGLKARPFAPAHREAIGRTFGPRILAVEKGVRSRIMRSTRRAVRLLAPDPLFPL